MTFRLFQVQEKLWQMCCSCAWGDAVDVWGHEVKGSGRWRRRCMKRWMKAEDGLGHGNSFLFLSPGYRFVRNHASERSCCMLRGLLLPSRVTTQEGRHRGRLLPAALTQPARATGNSGSLGKDSTATQAVPVEKYRRSGTLKEHKRWPAGQLGDDKEILYTNKFQKKQELKTY